MRVRCLVRLISSLVVSLSPGSFTPTLSTRHPSQLADRAIQGQPSDPAARCACRSSESSHRAHGATLITKSVRLWKPDGRDERHWQRAFQPECSIAPLVGRQSGSWPAGGTMQGLITLLSRPVGLLRRPIGRQGRARVSAEHGTGASADGTRYVSFGRYRLAYEVYGSGDRVLVWLHGLLLDANLSRGLAQALASRGNRVVLLDLLGHGRSDKPRHAGAHRMELYAGQVLRLLDELGVEEAVLGGVSL